MGDRVAFGKWLQKKRTDAGYTQSSAAQQLGFVSKASVVGYENGISSVPIERIFHISKVYRIALSEILERLKEYEPQIYEKYERLKNCFYESYTEEYFQNLSKEFRTMQGKSGGLHKQNYQDTGHSHHARHHRPFTNTFSYLENIRELTEVYIIRHRNNTPQDTPPEIYLPGLTDFAKIRPQNVLDIGTYAH